MSSLHLVALLTSSLVAILILLAHVKNHMLAIRYESSTLHKVDSVIIWPITSIVLAYVVPGFEPFVHSFCHEGALDIWHVRGQQWFWQYVNASCLHEETPYSRSQTDGLFLLQTTSSCFFTVHRPVMVCGDSSDVIHAWSLPDLGVKMDVIPGHISLDTFLPCVSGSFTGGCYEICGAYHALMSINVFVT